MVRKMISIFTPVYNEEENIKIIHEEVKKVMSLVSDRYDYEHVFSDNASQDNSRVILKEVQAKDRNVKVILLSRNFGITKSSFNGIYRCKGDAIVQIDADLQDSPKMILDFIKLWEQGCKVVYGVRKDRDEFWLMKTIRKLFYRLAEKLCDEVLIPDVGEFRLMDRRIVEELKKIKNYNPYLRGIVANLGFKQIGIPYVRDRRLHGKTSSNIFKLIDYGMNGIISHSSILLKLSGIAGIFLAMLSFILIVVYAAIKIISKTPPSGATTIIIFILFFAAMQMIFLGIIGEYLAKIFDQSISRPLVIEEELLGFNDA